MGWMTTVFIRVDHSHREQPSNNTCQLVFDPLWDRGYNFEPIITPSRLPIIEELPQEPYCYFRNSGLLP